MGDSMVRFSVEDNGDRVSEAQKRRAGIPGKPGHVADQAFAASDGK